MPELVKLVVTVPEEASDKIRQAIGQAGGGKVGNYEFCSFSSKGTGRFIPTEGANPAIGEVGLSEQVTEERIEFTCEKAKLPMIVAALRKAHPYEEPAIDIYPLLSI
jgi:hypothetical protein